MAENTTLEKRQGDTWLFPIQAEADDANDDLTHYKVYMTIKRNLSDADADAIWQGSGTLSAEGNLTLTVPKATTLNIQPAVYVYNMRAVNTTSNIAGSTQNGEFEVTLSTTRINT